MKDRLLAAVVAVAAIGYLYSDYGMPRLELGDPLGPRVFPAIVGLLLLASAIMLAWESRRRPAMPTPTPTPTPAAAVLPPAVADVMSPLIGHPTPKATPSHYPVLLAMVLWTIGYYAVFEPLGYILATIPYLFGLLCVFHRGRPVANALVACGFTAIAFGVFDHLLGVQLPPGPFGG